MEITITTYRNVAIKVTTETGSDFADATLVYADGFITNMGSFATKEVISDMKQVIDTQLDDSEIYLTF